MKIGAGNIIKHYLYVWSNTGIESSGWQVKLVNTRAAIVCHSRNYSYPYPHPLEISNDLLSGGYKYFLELHM